MNFFEIFKYKNYQAFSKLGKNIFIITGDEIFQKKLLLNFINNIFTKEDYNLIKYFNDKNIDKNWIYDNLTSFSLFSQKQIFNIILNEYPNKETQKILQELEIYANYENIIVIDLTKLSKQQQNLKWFKTLSTNKQALKITVYNPNLSLSINVLKFYCDNFLKINLENEVINYIATINEGNLISASQNLEKLNSYFYDNKNLIYLKSAQEILSNNQQNYTVFDLSNSVLECNIKKSLHILNNLLENYDEINLILWVICKDIRIIIKIIFILQSNNNQELNNFFKKNNIWKSQQELYLNLSQKIKIKNLYNILQRANKIDLKIKGFTNKINPKIELENIIMEFKN